MSAKQTARRRGQRAELLARDFLEAQGLTTRAMNYACRSGEIDVIMEHGAVLVFVEVRYRRSVRFGTPKETIDRLKRRRLVKAGEHYLHTSARTMRSCRFDVVTLTGDLQKPEIEWICDAFCA